MKSLYKKEIFLKDHAFELAEKILLSFSEIWIKLFTHELHLNMRKHQFLVFSWGRGGGGSDCLPPPQQRGKRLPKPPCLISKDFPSNYLLNFLFSCFYTLRLSKYFFFTSSCGAGRREIRRFVGGRI